MSNQVEVLEMGIFISGCADATLDPTDASASFAAPTATTPSPYVEYFRAGEGVSVWRHHRDVVRLVIVLGRAWAERAAYQGTDRYELAAQRALFGELSRALGAPLRPELEASVGWFHHVRGEEDVGLWIQVWASPNRYAPYSFTVVAVEPRLDGSHVPPWSY